MWVQRRRESAEQGHEASGPLGLGLLRRPQALRVLGWGWVFLLIGLWAVALSQPTRPLGPGMRCPAVTLLVLATWTQGRLDTGPRALPGRIAVPTPSPGQPAMESRQGRGGHKPLSWAPCT